MELMLKKKLSVIGVCLLLVTAVMPACKAEAATFYPAANTQASTTVAAGDHNIIGTSDVTVEEAKAWAQSHGATSTFISIADLYFKYSNECGQVNPGIAYAQSAKETNFGKFLERKSIVILHDETFLIISSCIIFISLLSENSNPKL